MANGTPADLARSENTILVISSAPDAARRFILQLVDSPVSASGSAEAHANGQDGVDGDQDSDLVPWLVENKYYSAQVYFRLCEVDEVELWERGTEVVLYAFVDSPPNPLPSALTKMMVAQPRDIALAIKLAAPHSPPFSSSDKDAAEELFDELGMELVVEDEPPENDDERPISPLESVRQTLMTHMWPNMQRKPLGVRMPLADDEDDEPLNVREDAEQASGSENPSGQEEPPASFPVDFTAGADAHAGPSTNGLHRGMANGVFPDIANLRSQIATANMAALRDLPVDEAEDHIDDRSLSDHDGLNAEAGPSRGISNMMSMLDRLEALDMANERDFSGSGSGAWGIDEDDDEEFMRDEIIDPREYDRLEDWLDDDDEEDAREWQNGESSFVVLPEDDQPGAAGSNRSEQPDEDRFEDDFTGFQSAPAPPSRSEAPARPSGNLQIPLDPTPLLLHLQSVRAELVGVADEDERRLRAGQEVERVMRSLGMSDADGLAGLL